MIILKKILNYFLIVFYALFIIEFITRALLFVPTNINVFKFGFDKNIIFEVVDLSKMQINIANKVIDNKNKILKKNTSKKQYVNIWSFGGSTTYGDNCINASSWVKELMKINNKTKVKNFAFNGADSDQLVAILNINLEKKEPPEIILWASKFNMKNILTKSDYRNKKILNYEFTDTKKNKIFMYIKRLDKSLKSYLLSYSFFDVIILRLNFTQNTPKKEFLTDKDIEMMVKNFELNTNEAIELSMSKGVNEFYIVSLFSRSNFNENNSYQYNLYNDYLKRANKKYFGYLKVIDLEDDLKEENEDYYLCDHIHQNLQGNIFQAKKINDFILKNSYFFKIKK